MNIMEIQSRWTSKVLWAAIAAQVLSLLQITGAFKAINIDAGVAGNVVAGLLQMLTLFGILNDPANKSGF